MPQALAENDLKQIGVLTDKKIRWLIALAVLTSAIMELIDTSAVNVSLPYIAGNLSASVDQATWVLTSYLVANAIILPLSGWMANYFGRKRLLMMSVSGFTVASILCGLAPSLPRWFCFACCKARPADRCSLPRGPSCSILSPGKSAVMPWLCGGWALS